VGDVVVGTCSWTDKTMIERWYPKEVRTPEQRLRYYAARYDTVEVDSTFYGIPRSEYAENWALRTPPEFVFHVKAYGLMTGHSVDERSLHPDIRDFDYELTPTGRVRNPEPRMVEAAFEVFLAELEPLREAGKLGGVLMQYPPWFTAEDAEHRRRNLDTIERGAALLEGLPMLVEFRHRSWVGERMLPKTLRFLEDRKLSYVAVDEPQIEGGTTMPPVVAATSPVGYVRLHGRNAGMWHARTASAADRFDYLYTPDELREWDDPVHHLADETERTYVMFNNCKYDYAPRNAREMAEILGDVVAPRRGEARTGDAAPDTAEVPARRGEEGRWQTGKLF